MSEITAGIDKLIAQIRADGVQAAQTEGERILATAEADAKKIVAAAKEKAAGIVQTANKDATRTREHMDVELRMAARDFILALGQRLRDQVINTAIEEETRARLDNPEVLERVISEVVSTISHTGDAEIIVSDEMRDVIAASAWKRIVERAKGELQLRGELRLSGFRLKLQDQHIVWDFSDRAVASELSRLVAPQLYKHFQLDDNAKSATSTT